MSELEQQLRDAARAVDWPATPRLDVPLGARPRRRFRPALVLAAAVLIAIAVAFAVPGARSAILRGLHLEGVTIRRVQVLPPAEERPLASTIGRPAPRSEVEAVLGRPPGLPALAGDPVLHLHGQVVSVLFEQDGAPVLLSELRSGGSYILKKLIGASTGVEPVQVGGAQGVWIAGAEHLYLTPEAPPRLAGNVLLWESNGILYRLEGRSLAKVDALRLGSELEGT